VVSVKSSQRNKWQEKMDSLQELRCSSQLSLYANQGSGSGDNLQGQLPHEVLPTQSFETNVSKRGWLSFGTDDDRDRNSETESPRKGRKPPLLTFLLIIQKLGIYASGLLTGLLLCQAFIGVITNY
jgi:hypothetical protein